MTNWLGRLTARERILLGSAVVIAAICLVFMIVVPKLKQARSDAEARLTTAIDADERSIIGADGAAYEAGRLVPAALPISQQRQVRIEAADENIPIVGSKSRILYADAEGRIRIARAFNDAIARRAISAPVVLGRDHHDVSGTDSPFRETANIYDGSRFTADMAVHNVIGDSFRGATWVSLHNGGGVGWGEVINGGFGLVLDGSPEAERRLESMLFWDVNNGIARRSWARNEGAIHSAQRAMEQTPGLKITLPNIADDGVVEQALRKG